MKNITQAGIYEYLNRIASGQDAAKRALSYIGFMHATRSKIQDLTMRDSAFKKSNVLLMGPTGCGKTHLAKALGDYLELPFIEIDAATITPTGYVGDDMASLISKEMSNQYKTNSKLNLDRAIIFIDEVDKLCIPASSTSGDFNAQKQDDILKLVEGKLIRSQNPKVNTETCMFVLAGSFMHLNKNKTRKSMGYTNRLIVQEEESQETLHKEVIKGGMKPELAGRISLIAELETLSEKDLRSAFMEVDNNIYSQYQEIFKHTNKRELTLTEEEISTIVTRCIKNGTGARGLQTELDILMSTTIFDLELKIELPELLDTSTKPLEVADLKLKKALGDIDDVKYEEALKEILSRYVKIT